MSERAKRQVANPTQRCCRLMALLWVCVLVASSTAGVLAVPSQEQIDLAKKQVRLRQWVAAVLGS